MTTLPDAADGGHLTTALRRAGALGDAWVASVTVISDRTMIMSRILRLELTYQGGAARGGANRGGASRGGAGPATVILKTGLPARMTNVWFGGRQEVAFYRQIAPTLPPGVVPGCFEAVHDGDTHLWHLLLEDLTDSHMSPTQWPLPPSAIQCQAILTALARHHAAWWDDPRLGVSVGTWIGAADATERLTLLEGHFARFADRLGEDLPAERRRLYERAFAAWPQLQARYRSHRDMTIAHGDAHVWNVFLPRDGGGDVRWFDWDSWRPGVATGDLVTMMALHWYPDRRARLERPLLDHYHAALVDAGVSGYDRAALDADYRLSVLLQIMTPVWQAAHDIPPMIWWSHLQRILLAADEWGCAALLD